MNWNIAAWLAVALVSAFVGWGYGYLRGNATGFTDGMANLDKVRYDSHLAGMIAGRKEERAEQRAARSTASTDGHAKRRNRITQEEKPATNGHAPASLTTDGEGAE